MSVIQKIRDKYARWAVIAIAVSLLGFILMDAFAGRTGMFSGQSNSTTLGKVDGNTIDWPAFDQKIKQQEAQYEAQNMPVSDDQRQRIMQDTWNQEVQDIVMKEQYEKLGLTVTDKELNDILYGNNPPQDLRQRFSDDSGHYNPAMARQEITRAMKDPGTKENIQKYFDFLKSQRLMEKYMALMTNTVYFPKWFLEKRNVDNSLIGKISYVSVPYATIPDSTVKITDDEIRDYMKAHKSDYEQKEETRSINYVLFSAAPSAADTATTKEQVQAMKADFETTKDPASFVMQGDFPFDTSYLAKSAIQVPAKDSIFTLAKGAVYGPYLDMDHFVLAKMIDSKILPDSAKVKHILIMTQNPQSGGRGVSDSVAKARIDSIRVAIEHGANFDTLAKRYSDDKSSADKGGLVQVPTQSGTQSDYFAPGQMVKAFNDSVFNGRVGERIVVKSEYGYHLIQILDLKNIEPHYKVAYLAKKIYTSTNTDQTAHSLANQFAGDSRSQQAFDANYDKLLRPKGISKLVAADIPAMQYNIQGVQGSARSFIKKLFNEADKGDVIGPDRIGDNYIVAVVTEVNKPGMKSVNSVRSSIEPVLKNQKKSEQIAQKIGKVTTPEDVAAKFGQQVQAVDSIRFGGGQQLGYEPKVIGATFNPDNKGKVVPEPIPGNTGVFVVRVENVNTVPIENGNVEEQARMLEMQTKQGINQQMQQGYNPIVETLKKAANIKDYRSKFF